MLTGGVQNGLKNADVINEQPLIAFLMDRKIVVRCRSKTSNAKNLPLGGLKKLYWASYYL